MSLYSRLTQAMSALTGSATLLSRTQSTEWSYRKVCQLMEYYYLNNGLYDLLTDEFRERDKWLEKLKAMRNPTFAAVEFYASTIWPGPLPMALPVETENKALPAAIEQVWRWSNWAVRKQAAIRQYAITGDMFLHVATKATVDGEPPRRVYIEAVPSKLVSDWETDEQGFVTMLRYEVAVMDGGQSKTQTDLWEKDTKAGVARLRSWTHTMGMEAKIESLGDPEREDEFPFDFVPWVWVPFADYGDTIRGGTPVIWPVLEKIDEANRKATRLAQLMFRYNKPEWALSSQMVTPGGQPIPAPKMPVDTTKTEVEDDTVWRLPGMAKLDLMVPPIDWAAHMAALAADLEEIARDLPEVRWYELAREGDISGRALEYKMAPATARAREARGVAESALVRAHQMAITIAQAAKMAGFVELGTYEDGALDHRFSTRDVLPQSEQDGADIAKVYVDMGVPRGLALKVGANWDTAALMELDAATNALLPVNKSDAQIVAEKEAVGAASAAQMETAMQAAMDAVSQGAVAQLMDSGVLDRVMAGAVPVVKAAGGNGR